MEFYKDCFILKDFWENAKDDSTTNLCAIYIPFRDKYKLTDSEAIRIAQGNMPASQILKIGERMERVENGSL